MARIVRVRVQSTWQNQQVLNTYSLLSDADAPASILVRACLNAMGYAEPTGAIRTNPLSARLAGAVADQAAVGVQYQSIYAFTPYDSSGLVDAPFPSGTTGQRNITSNLSPGFIAATVRSDRVRRDIRRGFKRYVGLSDADFDENSDLDAGFVTLMDAIAAAMNGPQSGTFGPDTFNFQYIVESKQRVITPDGVVYDDWPTETQALDNVATGLTWSAPETVTTQNSRKRGRGQ